MIAVVRDADGAVAGVNSVYATELDPIGAKPFYVHRCALTAPVRAQWHGMVRTAFDTLAAEFDQRQAGPIGLCVYVDDVEEMRRRPEGLWTDPKLYYAGYAGGRQMRIGYFPRARLGGPSEPYPDFTGDLEPLYRQYKLARFDEQDEFSEEDVIDVWMRHTEIGAQEAHRRRHEIDMIGSVDGELVAITTRYLQEHPRLGMDFWYGRTFVAPAHRSSLLASAIGTVGVEKLTQEYVDGMETRGHGIVAEIENEHIRTTYDPAEWIPGDYYFSGYNDRGYPVMVHFFPGATVPLPTS